MGGESSRVYGMKYDKEREKGFSHIYRHPNAMKALIPNAREDLNNL